MSVDELDRLIELLSSLRSKPHLMELPIQEIGRLLVQELTSMGLRYRTIKRYMDEFRVLSRYVKVGADLTNQALIDAYLSRYSAVKSYNNAVSLLHKLGRLLGIRSLQEIRYRSPPIKPVYIHSSFELSAFRSALRRKERLLYDLLLSSGLRIWESFMLRRLDLIELEGVVMLDATQIHKGRTKRSFFTFTLPSVASRLVEYANERGYNTYLLMPEPRDDNPDRLAHIMASVSRRKFYSASRETGIKVRPHDLRRVFTTYMLRSGMPLIFIEVLTGRVANTADIKSYVDVRQLANLYKQSIGWLKDILGSNKK